MAPVIATEVVPLVSDVDGVIRIGATRVTLDAIVASFLDGATAEEIVYQYSSLELHDVYSVIAYYLRQRAEVEEYLRQRRDLAAVVREQDETRFDPVGVRDRLLARSLRS